MQCQAQSDYLLWNFAGQYPSRYLQTKQSEAKRKSAAHRGKGFAAIKLQR